MPVPSNDMFEVAKNIARAHADALQKDEQPTVDSLLLETGLCPECGGPLLLCDGAGYCRICGTAVDSC